MNNCLTIIPKCNTESVWISENPIIRYKEFIVTIDNNQKKYKLGDGSSRYNDLPFSTLEYALDNGYIYCESQTLPNTCKIKLNKFSK